MSLLRLVFKNIRGNTFRSLAVLLCAALVAGLALTATFVVRGAEGSLRRNLERLGADILVLPWGTMTEKIGGIRLMSAAIDGWMPRPYMDKIAALQGVAQVSPQLHLTALDDSPYSPYPQMYLVAFDPATDFSLQPWLDSGETLSLAAGEAVAGAHIALPDGGAALTLYATPIKIVDHLAATETSIDSTLFVSFETAEQIIANSEGQGDATLQARPGTISAVMVRIDLDSEVHEVAVRILEEVPGVVPLENPGLFQTERRQMIGVLRTILGALTAIWVLAVAFMGLVFSLVVNERRYEIGVLRALGFPGTWILKTLLLEGASLALMGGFAGVLVTIAGFATLGDQVTEFARLSIHLPSPLGLVSLSLGGQTLALISVTMAAFIPAWRISHEEVAMTMRE